MKAGTRVIGFAVLLAVNLASCEQIKCQMMPLETEDGLMGYCCMFPKASFKEQFMHQVVKNGESFRHGTRMDSTLYSKARPLEFYPGQYFTENNEKFMDQHRRLIIDEYESRRSVPEDYKGVPQHLPSPSLPHPRANIDIAKSEETKTADDVMHNVLKNLTGSKAKFSDTEVDSKNEVNNSSSNVSGEGLSPEHSLESSDEKNGTVPIINNRNNVNVPKTCVGDEIKTEEGNCVKPFV